MSWEEKGPCGTLHSLSYEGELRMGWGWDIIDRPGVYEAERHHDAILTALEYVHEVVDDYATPVHAFVYLDERCSDGDCDIEISEFAEIYPRNDTLPPRVLYADHGYDWVNRADVIVEPDEAFDYWDEQEFYKQHGSIHTPRPRLRVWRVEQKGEAYAYS